MRAFGGRFSKGTNPIHEFSTLMVHSSAPLILVLAVRLTQANEIEQFGVSRGAKCAHSTPQCGLATAFMTYHERLRAASAQSV